MIKLIVIDARIFILAPTPFNKTFCLTDLKISL